MRVCAMMFVAISLALADGEGISVENPESAGQSRLHSASVAPPVGETKPLYDTSRGRNFGADFTPTPTVEAPTFAVRIGDMVSLGGPGATNFLPNILMDVYIVPHRAWMDGNSLKARAVHRSLVKSDATGTLPRTQLWRADRLGVFDVIVDYDNDGAFSSRLDAIAAFEVCDPMAKHRLVAAVAQGGLRAGALPGVAMGLGFAAGIEISGLDPGRDLTTQNVARLIRQLGHARFLMRETARKELEAIGERALPALLKTAASEGDLEIRRRAERIIQAITARIRAAASKE